LIFNGYFHKRPNYTQHNEAAGRLDAFPEEV
jgi:hypothetical protein